MRLGLKDKKVIEAFLNHRSAEGHKLSTDGESLDGHWLGGTGIVRRHAKDSVWGGGLYFPDTGSKIADSIQKTVTRMHDAPFSKSARKTRKRR